MLWIQAVSVPASGSLAASTDAGFIVRSKTDEGATEATPVKSFVFKDAESDLLKPHRLVCCDIALVSKPAVEFWDGKGTACSSGVVTITKLAPTASSATASKPTATVAAPSTIKVTEAPADNTPTAAGPATQVATANSAGSISSGVFGLLASAAALLAALL